MARSEYGLLKWILKEIEASDLLELQLVVGGAHLDPKQGETIREIREDGLQITCTLEIGTLGQSRRELAEYVGDVTKAMAAVLEHLQPDALMVLGDRYELLGICNAALLMNVPILHISGGDVTEGAIDNEVRNAITMMAEVHFPGNEKSAENIRRMRGANAKIVMAGEPGLDAFYRCEQVSREVLAEDLGLDAGQKWALLTYHPETRLSLEENLAAAKACVEAAACREDLQIVATYANADYGGAQINEYLEEAAKIYPKKLHVVPSLGQKRYLSFMREAALVLGNSSSGIVEAPFLGIPVINVGERQKGRHMCGNVRCVAADVEQIREQIHEILSSSSERQKAEDAGFWGDGHAAEQIVSYLEHMD